MLPRKKSAKCALRNIRPLSNSERSITSIKIGEINEMPAVCAWIKNSDNDSLDMWERPSPDLRKIKLL